ncbi:ATP-dependent metallopeptidase FtsH/Yme1/Tma family protein [Aminipila butyrica]|uniref:ATP-dependent zinc metalloprotease FtsH n=2 Tax=Aminipila butyrica TaxID=433296 RepID=A0A858BXU0_9FIRM|nr:ATP-dependent metallopeptidase FtsH/Yme1/Tma family protein [Aminipila butyrica]
MGIYVAIFVIVLVMAWAYQGIPQENEVKTVDFSNFVTQLQKENVKEVNITDGTVRATLKNGDKIISYAPSIMDISMIDENYIYPQIEKGIIYNSDKPKATPWYISMLPTLIMILALVFFWFIMMNQSGGGGKVMSFGKSRARMHKDDELKKVTYKEVAGLDEEKEELAEVVDFLRNPKKYRDLGARIPKGILLVGPPGTGKTYLSKATAGEAGVPFFSISGSDFVEMFVGVGASRVRDLFEQAKKSSPCIIFIDEIDAVGRKRGAGIGGGHDEREQTLNQLLVEMDGFGENTGIIILAATNRPDILDPALLRPGRFDRQVVIGVPDIKGREAIFTVHSRNKPLDESVNPKVMARRTPGFTPADIENLLNEAALLAARRNGRKIRMDEIEEAITKVIAGPEKKSRVINEDERKLTAYHEAGHAIVARSLPKTDPVHQITIIPRGRAGGFTMILPKEDRSYGTKITMREQIVHLLGGRVAEKLTLDDISTGASNDIMRATEIARDMVTKYGFSEKLGPINYSSTDEVFLGNDYQTKKNYSEAIAKEIDAEIRAIIEDCFEEAERLLTDNMDKLHVVAKTLLEIETLDGEQFENLYTGKYTSEELLAHVREKEEVKKLANAEEAAETERLLKEEEERERALLAAFDTDYMRDEAAAEGLPEQTEHDSENQDDQDNQDQQKDKSGQDSQDEEKK